MKPDKPRDDFPFFPHRNGQWAKKIKGKLHYFGKWDDPASAEAKYHSEKKFLELGVEPPKPAKLQVVTKTKRGLRMVDGINLFLTDAERRMLSGELGARSFKDLKATAGRILEAIDRDAIVNDMPPSDWGKIKKRFGSGTNATTVSSEITRAKIIMNWLKKNRHLEREPNYGTAFDKPSKAKQRIAKQSASRRWFDAYEVRELILGATQPLKTMIVLGVNCGFGNGDCASLEASWIDLKEATSVGQPSIGKDALPVVRISAAESRADFAKTLSIRPASSSFSCGISNFCLAMKPMLSKKF